VTSSAAAIETIEQNALAFIGPINLLQGGRAILARKPIFTNQTLNETTGTHECTFNFNGYRVPENFWGYVTMLTYIDDLRSTFNLQFLFEENNIEFELRAPYSDIDLVYSSAEFHPSEKEAFGDLSTIAEGYFAYRGITDYEIIPIQLKDEGGAVFQSWELAFAPRDGWATHSVDHDFQIVLLSVFAVILFMTGFLIWTARTSFHELTKMIAKEEGKKSKRTVARKQLLDRSPSDSRVVTKR
jgi:hypothetical protein